MNFSLQPITLLLATIALIAGCTDDPTQALQDSGTNSGTNGVNSPPTISGTPPRVVAAGNGYSFSPSASDPDGDSLSFSISNRPAWASFDANNGQLSGNPDQGDVGTTSGIIITANDGEQNTSLASFSVTVQTSTSNSTPTISGNPPNSVVIGQEYNFKPVYADTDGDTLTYSISNAPPWAELRPTGRFRGTPDAGDIGTYSNITISVTDGQSTAALSPFSITVQAASGGGGGGNMPPVISGTPAASVTQDTAYSFQPAASDADGNQLTFSISNQPGWSSFDTATGQLSGTPAAGDVATYSGIVIAVTDGTDNVALPAFAIDVVAVATGSVTLSWTAPTMNDNNTQLTDLAGFKIYWGTSSGSYPNSVTIDNPGLTTYVVENLVPNTYYFVSTAYNSASIESQFSNEAVKIAQ